MYTPEFLSQAIAHTIETYRKEKGISKVALAEKAGIQDSYLRGITYPLTKRNPSMGVVWSIIDALGVPVSVFMEKTEKYRQQLLKEEKEKK